MTPPRIDDDALPPAHADALAWAARHWPAAEAETVGRNNWAATYRLDGTDGPAWLKVVPAHQQAQLPAIAAVARRFPGAVPAVLALAPGQGWLLLADHGGEAIDGEDEDLVAVAEAYGRLQAEAAGDADLLGALRRVVLADELPALLDFLRRDAAQTGAAHFIGEAAAARYARLIGRRADLLAALVARAARLPVTLDHGDLHGGNVAWGADGGTVFYDWDELAAGPAGLSLHGLLSGSTTGAVVLRRLAAGEPVAESTEAAVLRAHVDALVAGGYAPRALLLEALPGAMAAGQMRFITSFGRYPGEAGLEAAGDTLTRRLSDLLDLCDWLASQAADTAFAMADDYEAAGEWSRAQRLVQDRLSRTPADAALLARYARLAARLGDAATAEEAWQELLRHRPGDDEAERALAQLWLDRLALDDARAMARAVLARAPGDAGMRALAARAEAMAGCLAEAARPDGWPRVRLSDEEQRCGRLEPSTQALLLALFRQQGVVQVDNLYSLDHIARLQAAFQLQQATYLDGRDHDDVLRVGDRRYMLTMALDEVFGAPEMVASGLYLPLMQALLGPDCILGAYTAVVSMPGSADQEPHKDHSALFEEMGWQHGLPTFAAQVIVPLRALDETTGATRVFKGSQHVPLHRAVESLPHQDPVVPLGSGLLLDYSVAHYGRGNRSDALRPILNLIYSRPWFRDCRNYHLQPPLRFAPDYLDRAPAAVRPLVAWWDLERRAATQSLA